MPRKRLDYAMEQRPAGGWQWAVLILPSDWCCWVGASSSTHRPELLRNRLETNALRLLICEMQAFFVSFVYH